MSTELPTPSITDRAAAQARVQIEVNNLRLYAGLLRAALVDYGRHQHGCPALYYDGQCACGFTAALVGLIPREQHPVPRAGAAGAEA
jgi:hypothetical protein